MKIYVVRHGVTKRNKEHRFNGQCDEPLEPEGFEQAACTREKLPTDLCKIYSSDLIRTIQTAEVLNKNLGLEIIKCPEIREVDFGTITGEQYMDSEGNRLNLPGFNWDVWTAGKYNFHSFGGESVEDVKNRVHFFINKLKYDHKDTDKVLVVTHGGVVRTLYREYKNTIPEHMDNASLHEFEI